MYTFVVIGMAHNLITQLFQNSLPCVYLGARANKEVVCIIHAEAMHILLYINLN